MSKTKQFSNFKGDPKTLHPLSLAFVGDGVFELLVRGKLIETPHISTRNLHRLSIKEVSAPAQAKAYDYIAPFLTEIEADIVRRGRNAKVSRVPKSSTVAEYHKSTAFEALFGYLFLNGELERIYELYNMILEKDGSSK